MINWIKKTLSEKDGTPSSKRQMMAFVVALSSIIVSTSFALSKEIPATALTLLQTLLGAVGVSYSITRFTEKKENDNNG
jgi:hypothetical protein